MNLQLLAVENSHFNIGIYGPIVEQVRTVRSHVRRSTTVDQPTFQLFLAHREHSFITVTASLARAVPLHMTNLVAPEALALKRTTVFP